VAKDELDELLKNADFQKRKVPMLFFANKMDDRHAMSVMEVCRIMGETEMFQNTLNILCKKERKKERKTLERS